MCFGTLIIECSLLRRFSIFLGIIFFESSSLQRFPFPFAHFHLPKFPFPSITISIWALSAPKVPFSSDYHFHSGTFVSQSSLFPRLPFSFGHFLLRKFPFPPITSSIWALSSSKVPLHSKFQFHLGTFITQSSLFLQSPIPFGHFLLRKFHFTPSFNFIWILSSHKAPLLLIFINVFSIVYFIKSIIHT